MNANKNKVWLIGSGYMAIEFAKVLKALDKAFICIGRGSENANNFKQATGVDCTTGGLEAFLKLKPEIPEAVLVAASIESLTPTVTALLNYGVKNLLVEKPGVGMPNEIHDLNRLAIKEEAKVYIGYNRRFYASVIAAQKIIKEDKGVTSFAFEFTEWSHKIKDLQKHPIEHNYWFLGNSTHVIDTAFFIAGKPKHISCYVRGNNSLNWHPASSIFSGAGETEAGALFSYHANWQAPGRWVIEMFTAQHRLIFKPLEKLQIQKNRCN